MTRQARRIQQGAFELPRRKASVQADRLVAALAILLITGAGPATADETVGGSEDSIAGASVRFVTLEAEDPDNKTNGTVISAAPGYRAGLAEYQASGHAYVALRGNGQFLRFANVPQANSIVIRFSLPAGNTSSVALYVNGAKRQTLALVSPRAWLSRAADRAPASGNSAKDAAPMFWDEASFRITGPLLQAGDELSLQVDSGNTALPCGIDCIDLEKVGPPRPMPVTGFLSVKSFGAVGNGNNDDTAAIASCITAAKAQGKGVFIPEGTYVQTAAFQIDGLAVEGAGMWYTKLLGKVDRDTWSGDIGFYLAGNGAQVSNLAIEGRAPGANASGLGGGRPFTGAPTNWKIENVWITHTLTGVWMGGSNGAVRDCRIRAIAGGGIDLNCGASSTLVENNHIRGAGSDGISINSETNEPTSTADCVCNNTVVANWAGANCALRGGTDLVVERNAFSDNAGGPCLAISPSAMQPMSPLTGARIRDNILERGGGAHGSLIASVETASVCGLTICGNEIIESAGAGIELDGNGSEGITFSTNQVESSVGAGVLIRHGVAGAGTFVSSIAGGTAQFVSDNPPGENTP